MLPETAITCRRFRRQCRRFRRLSRRNRRQFVAVFGEFVASVDWPLKRSRLRRFKSDRDEIWQDCSASKYTSIAGVGFSIWRNTFKTAPMALFRAEKCCNLVSADELRFTDYKTLYICTSIYNDIVSAEWIYGAVHGGPGKPRRYR